MSHWRTDAHLSRRACTISDVPVHGESGVGVRAPARRSRRDARRGVGRPRRSGRAVRERPRPRAPGWRVDPSSSGIAACGPGGSRPRSAGGAAAVPRQRRADGRADRGGRPGRGRDGPRGRPTSHCAFAALTGARTLPPSGGRGVEAHLQVATFALTGRASAGLAGEAVRPRRSPVASSTHELAWTRGHVMALVTGCGP
jgi:hypothetical protein